ncbi:MAG: carbohydrate ABC transporter permease [Lachnospiraceae bacterium]|jgi:raffinose/stachyose/melibiose transport system permease protein|nr:carbohydrate ABC transporter permease [Lachnospiraceae bacterium]
MKQKVGKIVIYIVLVVYAAISVYPLIWMLLYSFKDNNEIFVTNPFGFPRIWRFENYVSAFQKFNVLTYFRNSLVVALVTIILVELCALMFCYVIARVHNRATAFFHFVVSSGMFIPIQAIMIPLVIMVRRFGFTNSLFSIILPYTALGLPFACMLFYGFYLGIPIELEESAFMDGANLGTIYFRIILPQMKSPIVVLVIYQFMSCWNEFNLALIFLTKDNLKTLPLGLVNFWNAYEAQWGQVGAAMIMASVPVLIIYLLFSSQITDAMSASGMKN